MENLRQQVLYLVDEERGLKIGVAPQSGGEMCSLQFRWRGDWHELLYRANQFDPPEGTWRGRAPFLFPAVGRNYTPDQLKQVQTSGREERIGSYTYRGVTYQMPCHGFVMDRPWRVVSAGESSALTCAISSDAVSRQYYPFDFELSAGYSLLEGIVNTRVVVSAHPENDDKMFFSLGNHLTLVAPFTEAGEAGSCIIRSPGRVSLQLSPQSLFSGETTSVDFGAGVRLREYPGLGNFVLGGFPEGECWVEFIDPASFGLRVSQREVTSESRAQRTSPESYYFVFYSPYQADEDQRRTFFCPEPWFGGPNSLNERRGLVFLQPGEKFIWEMNISFCS